MTYKMLLKKYKSSRLNEMLLIYQFICENLSSPLKKFNWPIEKVPYMGY